VALYLWQKFGMSHPVLFITVPFEAVAAEILEKIASPMMGVVLKRMMLRAAATVAEQLEIGALVTGESVAQVSSQTLTNLCVIEEVTTKLVLRPLIMTDKQDIVDQARKIGTEEFSAVMPEYCGVISVKPTTRAKLPRVQHAERLFDFAVLKRAIEGRVALDIRTMETGTVAAAQQSDEPISIPADKLVILDIRHPDEEDRSPLTAMPYPVEKVPFFRLNTRFTQLPPERHYLLYCDKGVMSRLHAAHLKEQGHGNVGIYRK
jgi:thiamine biosynthesis protein ThiI